MSQNNLERPAMAETYVTPTVVILGETADKVLGGAKQGDVDPYGEYWTRGEFMPGGASEHIGNTALAPLTQE